MTKTCYNCKNLPKANGYQNIPTYNCKEYVDGCVKVNCPHWETSISQYKTIDELNKEEL